MAERARWKTHFAPFIVIMLIPGLIVISGEGVMMGGCATPGGARNSRRRRLVEI